jgi:hypothetical protein
MNQIADIDRFVKDPSLLVDLCREVIEQIDISSDDADIGEREAQLREIANTIQRLEKANVSVPDVLRAEKSRLVTSLAIHADSTQTLSQLANELDDILKDLNNRLGRDSNPSVEKRPRVRRSVIQKTSYEVLRDLIIRTLRNFGGRGKVAKILDAMEQELKGKFSPGDLEVRRDGKTLAWRNNAQWERLRMVHDGTLRNDSPNGVWELSETRR